MRRNKKHTPQNPRTKTTPAANTTATTVTNTPTATPSSPVSASTVQIFNNPEFGDVRVVMQEGEPWFVGKDVAKILGYTNPSKAIADHVDVEDKLNNESLSSLGQRGGWIINESGLYSLILSSKLPSAKKFKRWVTSEVLPTIRKTGGYVDQNRSEIELRLFSNKKGTIFYCPLSFIFYIVLLFSPTCPVSIYIRNYHIYSQSFHYQEIL